MWNSTATTCAPMWILTFQKHTYVGGHERAIYQQSRPNKTAAQIFNGMTLMPVHLIPMIYSDGTPLVTSCNGWTRTAWQILNYLYFSGYCKSLGDHVSDKGDLGTRPELHYRRALSRERWASTVLLDNTSTIRCLPIHSTLQVNADSTLILEQKMQVRLSPIRLHRAALVTRKYIWSLFELQAHIRQIAWWWRDCCSKPERNTVSELWRTELAALSQTERCGTCHLRLWQPPWWKRSFGSDGQWEFLRQVIVRHLPRLSVGAWFVMVPKFFQHLLSVVNKFGASCAHRSQLVMMRLALPAFSPIQTMNTGATGNSASAARNGSSQNWMGGTDWKPGCRYQPVMGGGACKADVVSTLAFWMAASTCL